VLDVGCEAVSLAPPTVGDPRLMVPLGWDLHPSPRYFPR
jgi:hypothetical protein